MPVKNKARQSLDWFDGEITGLTKKEVDIISKAIQAGTGTDDILTKTEGDQYYAKKTELNSKQNNLVSGTNIKTINNQSILGSGNIQISQDMSNYYSKSEVDTKLNTKANNGTSYTKVETDTKLNTKQNVLVSGTNIKTVNGQSLVGSGNITILTRDSIGLSNYITVNEDLTSGTITDEGLSIVKNTNHLIFTLVTKNNQTIVLLKEYSTPVQLMGLYFENNKYYLIKFTINDNKTVNISGYNLVDENALQTEVNKINQTLSSMISAKQDKLVSGTSIKTINGQSLLGSGDITIEASSGTVEAITQEELEDILV